MAFLKNKNAVNGLTLTFPAGFLLGSPISQNSNFLLDLTHNVIISGGENLIFDQNSNNFRVNFAPGDFMIISKWIDNIDFAGNVRFDFSPPVTAVGAQIAVDSDIIGNEFCEFRGWFGVCYQNGNSQQKRKGKTTLLRDGSAIFMGARCEDPNNKIAWIAFDVNKITGQKNFTRFIINQLKVEL